MPKCERRDAYAALTDDEWAWTLAFLTSGGAALTAYPEYRAGSCATARYVVQDARDRAPAQDGDRHDRRRRADRRELPARAARSGRVEESFIARLKPGDRFVFAGTPLEFVRVRDMKAWVRRASER